MNATVLLLVSLIPLLVAPATARLVRRSEVLSSALDGLVAVAVGGIALLHVFPYAYRSAGHLALGATAAGFLVPLAIERWQGHGHRGVRSWVLGLAFAGLGIHALLDGVALFAPDAAALAATAGDAHYHPPSGVPLLALAVILHRFPMALAVWWFAAPSLGRRIATALLALMGAGTVAGYFAAGQIWPSLSSASAAVLQALIAGMLLHIVLGHHHAEAEHAEPRGSRAASAAGAVAGVAVLAALAGLHPLETAVAGGLSLGSAFLALAAAVAPALLLAFVALALLDAWLPPAARPWLLAGAAAPPRPAAGVLLRPELQLPALFVSLALLGAPVALWRLLSVAVVATLAAVSLRRRLDAGADPPAHPLAEEALRAQTSTRGLLDGLRFAFGPAVDRALPPLLFGLGVAALLEPLASLEWLLARPMPAQLTLLALAGIPLYLGGLGATPILAVLAGKGVGLGPLLAFVLGGAAAAAARPLARGFGARIAWELPARAVVLGIFWSYVLAGLGTGGTLTLAAAPGPLALAALVVLAALVLDALVRQGFRDFLDPAVTRRDLRPRAHGAPAVVGQERLEELLAAEPDPERS